MLAYSLDCPTCGADLEKTLCTAHKNAICHACEREFQSYGGGNLNPDGYAEAYLGSEEWRPPVEGEFTKLLDYTRVDKNLKVWKVDADLWDLSSPDIQYLFTSGVAWLLPFEKSKKLQDVIQEVPSPPGIGFPPVISLNGPISAFHNHGVTSLSRWINSGSWPERVPLLRRMIGQVCVQDETTVLAMLVFGDGEILELERLSYWLAKDDLGLQNLILVTNDKSDYIREALG